MTPARPDALGVECETCGSGPGERCFKVPYEPYGGRPPLRKPHAARIKRAAERAEKGETK